MNWNYDGRTDFYIWKKICSKLCPFYTIYFIILFVISLDFSFQTIFKTDLTSWNNGINENHEPSFRRGESVSLPAWAQSPDSPRQSRSAPVDSNYLPYFLVNLLTWRNSPPSLKGHPCRRRTLIFHISHGLLKRPSILSSKSLPCPLPVSGWREQRTHGANLVHGVAKGSNFNVFSAADDEIAYRWE